MLKKILISFLMVSCSSQINAIALIGLGEVCTVAAGLGNSGLRIIAYPFDWVISPFEGIYNAFKNDFEGYFEADSLTVRHDQHGVVNSYGFQFVHDLPTIQTHSGEKINDEFAVGESVLRNDWREFIPAVKEKYQRRINRLRNVLLSDEKVFLIRHCGVNQGQAVRLRDLLHKKYPNLDFTLVIVERGRGVAADWNLKRIRNFNLDDSAVWNDPAQWKAIFRSLGIEPTRYSAADFTDCVCHGHHFAQENF